MWFHCLLIFAFSGFFRCARNRIWWWWLYFASITFRRSELVAIPSLKAKPKKNVKIHCIDKCHEGDDNKHHLHNDATGSLKAKAVSGAGRCLTFQFSNITSRFQVSLFGSTARHFKASIRPKKPSKTEPFRFRDRRPRMYPWDSLAGGRDRQREEDFRDSKLLLCFCLGFCALPRCLIPEKISVEHPEHPAPRTCLGISLSTSFPRRSWHLAISAANRPQKPAWISFGQLFGMKRWKRTEENRSCMLLFSCKISKI